MPLTQMNPGWLLVLGWLALTSLAGFLLMGIDKSRAIRRERRVRERTFYKLAAVGGAFGIVVATGIFHHKTAKDSFTDVAYVAAIAWVVILIVLADLMGPPV